MSTKFPGKRAPALNELGAGEIARAVCAGELTREVVARACLDRIAAREPAVEAWQHLDQQQVIAAARALDANGKHGPLAGVPFGVKDIIDTCDMPTEYGSPIYKGHRPTSDAACVALARKAGGVLMGKTVTAEFANRHPGKTHNPHDPARTPGGSSSGSAAAVADFMVPLAVGTQTNGSTIRPASFCGVFGYRPTYGDLRLTGVKEAAGTLDTLGLFARSVEDIALYRDVLLGVPPEPVAGDAPAPRIGFCRTHLWPTVQPYAQKLLEEAVGRLAKAGAKVGDVTLPEDFAQLEGVQRVFSGFEIARNLTWEIENHWEKISETMRNDRIRSGLACGLERYREARDFAERCRPLLDHVFEDYDILLAASADGEAPVGLHSTGNAALCSIWTTNYAPCMNVPAFTGPNGLPVGMQLVARRGNDRGLFSAARWACRYLEQTAATSPRAAS